MHVLRRHADIGKSKAEVAAKFINDRIPGCHVTPYPYLTAPSTIVSVYYICS